MVASQSCRLYSPNVVQNWRWQQRFGKRSDEKGLGAALTLIAAGGVSQLDRLRASKRVRVTLTRIGPRQMDKDNNVGSLKGIQDGVAEMLQHDDGDESYFDWQYAQRRGEYGVEVRIEVMS